MKCIVVAIFATTMTAVYKNMMGNDMRQSTVKPVLLSKHQIDAIREIQEQERVNSQLGVAPSIHAIARQLMDKALEGIKR